MIVKIEDLRIGQKVRTVDLGDQIVEILVLEGDRFRCVTVFYNDEDGNMITEEYSLNEIII